MRSVRYSHEEEENKERFMENPKEHELVLYKNRKFRSRREKRYMTLDEIAEAIKSGDAIVIRRHETGEDVTSEYLKGIFRYLEIDLGSLHKLIRHYPIKEEVLKKKAEKAESAEKNKEE